MCYAWRGRWVKGGPESVEKKCKGVRFFVDTRNRSGHKGFIAIKRRTESDDMSMMIKPNWSKFEVECGTEMTAHEAREWRKHLVATIGGMFTDRRGNTRAIAKVSGFTGAVKLNVWCAEEGIESVCTRLNRELSEWRDSAGE